MDGCVSSTHLDEVGSSFIIYLPRILCLCVCVCVCVTICVGTLCYSFSLSNQTDQGDDREGFEREGYRWRDRKGKDDGGRV